MQAQIETLKAKNSNDEEYLVYPRTLIKCVTNENGDNFEDTMKDFVATEIADVISGTTQVGNAKTLDGHGAEYFYQLFAPTTAIPSGADLNTYLTVGTFGIESATIAQSLLNRPSALIRGGKLVVENTHNKNNFYQTIYSSDGVFRRYVSSGTFNNWETIFTTAGGTINGDVELYKESDALLYMMLKNALRQINIEVQKGGTVRLRDATNSKDIINSTVDGTNTFNGHASKDLPLTGGTITAENDTPLTLKSNTVGVNLRFMDNAGNAWYLGFNSDGEPRITGKGYLLHTGNKPTGSYTGNGSTVKRTIATGGTGRFIFIFGDNGTCAIASKGAIGREGATVKSLTASEVDTDNSNLYIISADACINASGVVYTYYVA